jgi:membrane dipeptidase
MRVFDLHCDTIDRLGMASDELYLNGREPESIPEHLSSLAHNKAALAFDRMADACVSKGEQGEETAGWCQCYGIWIPDMRHSHDAFDFYRRARNWFADQMIEHADKVEQIRNARDIEGVLARGKVAAVLTVENALTIGHSVRAIDELVEDGVKMVTLTWNGRNPIGSGNDCPADGLTTFGREAIRALEDARIVVDVSHLNAPGFYDLLDVARRPFVASHSNARAVCDVPRNLTDDEFRMIRDAGGLVGINYFCDFIGRHGSAEAAPAEADSTRPAEPTFDDLAAHIEHFLDLGGERVIALGSDFDGARTPSWLSGCECLPAYRAQVAARFGEDLARKMFFENARDFFARNETA